MNRLKKIVPLFVLVAALLIAGIAATPAVLSKPVAPTIEATTNAEEVTITWNRIPGAQYYTVGWINWTEGKPVLDAGEDWLKLFHYTTVPGDETSYTVKGQVGGDTHYAIIRATDVEGTTNGRFGGSYSTWSDWSSRSARPERGIVGLPPGVEYLGVGDIRDWDGYEFAFTGVASPLTVTWPRSDGTEYERAAPNGRRWLSIGVNLNNQRDGAIDLDEDDHVLWTDRGAAIGTNVNFTLEAGESYPSGTTLLYDVPEDATVAVLAVRPFIDGAEGADNAPQLFRLIIPAS